MILFGYTGIPLPFLADAELNTEHILRQEKQTNKQTKL